MSELTFCPQCRVIHPRGRHLADPSRPGAGLEPERLIVAPPAAQVVRRATVRPQSVKSVRQVAQKPATKSNFNKTDFQRDYMRDRRAMDKAGLSHLTVKQYRAQREQQAV